MRQPGEAAAAGSRQRKRGLAITQSKRGEKDIDDEARRQSEAVGEIAMPKRVPFGRDECDDLAREAVPEGARIEPEERVCQPGHARPLRNRGFARATSMSCPNACRSFRSVDHPRSVS
jgi:hypothetical protein